MNSGIVSATLVALILFIHTSSSEAQEAKVALSGTVTDSVHRQPVTGVRILCGDFFLIASCIRRRHL